MKATAKQAIQSVLANPCVSFWAKDALRSALARDPIDAARDAAMVRDLLDAYADELLRQ